MCVRAFLLKDNTSRISSIQNKSSNKKCTSRI